MAYYGYIRVSTKGQVPGTSLAEQEQQIKERYPTAIIVKEAASGAHERQVFDNLCKSLQAGDTLVVCKMDRFCRSAKEGLQYVDLLRDKGVAVHILNMGLLDNSPMGRLVATMLLAFAEFERAQIIERTQSGRQAAMAKPGFRDGRPLKFTALHFQKYPAKGQEESRGTTMKITIKLSETNNALLNRVVKEEKVDASEFANSAFLDKFLPVSEKLGIEAGFILQEHEAGTLDAWLVKQCISRGIRWLGNHPIRDCAILKQILVRFPFSAKDNGKISTCNECVQSDMDSVVALLKERVPGYVPSKDEYNGLVEDVLANWKYIWNEAIVYNVLATIVYTNEPKKDFEWYDGLKLLHLIDFAAWQQWCDA